VSAETAPRQTSVWGPVVYGLAGVALVLLIASFAGNGTGLFGWGFMMASMWVWILLVVVALVLLGFFMGQKRTG
jgi:FtsH-binding integral membrane protein